MSLADIRTKSKKKPPRIVAYGGAGVGKTYFGSQMPNPIFILTEDGMGTIDAPQFDLCKDACKALNIPVIIHDEYEADDIIATFAKQFGQEEQVIIVTCDKDMYQLITDNVSIYNIIKKSFVKKEQVIEKFGVTPEQMITYQAIVGDKCDNIIGIHGIGPKSAKVIIESMDKKEDEMNQKEKRLIKKFEENKDIYIKNLDLVRLHTDIEISVELNAFHMKFFKDNKYKDIVTPLGFRV